MHRHDHPLDHPTPSGDIPIALTPEEAFGLAWILRQYLLLRPRPLTPLQDRLAGLSVYLQDQLPDQWAIPDASLDRTG